MPLPLTHKYTTTPTVTSRYFSKQNSLLFQIFYLHFFATKISIKSTFDILLSLAVSVFLHNFFPELPRILFNIQQMSLLSSTLTQCRHSKVSHTQTSSTHYYSCRVTQVMSIREQTDGQTFSFLAESRIRDSIN